MGLRVERYGPLSTMVVVGRLVGTFEAALDDRFHEGGNRGTDDLLADSSFAVSGTRSGIMARWRQAVEAAMTDEEIGSSVAVENRAGEPGGAGADAACLP